jgi:hypothetical protein
MLRAKRLIWAFVLVLLLVPSSQAANLKGDATSLVPDDAIIVLQVTNARGLIDQAFDQRVVSLVESLPPYQEAMSSPETQQALGLVRFFENKYDLELPELLAKLVGGGITLAVLPGERNVLIVESEDAKILTEVHDFFRTIAEGEAAKQGNPDRVKSAEYRGVQGWSFAPNEVHAIVGKCLLLADKPEALKVVLDHHAEEGTNSIGNSPRFQAAQKALDPDAEITLFADMKILKQLPGFLQAMEQNENPLGRLLFAPLMAGANQATWLAAGIDVEQDNVTVEMLADKSEGQPTALDSFALPASSQDGAMPNLVVPRQIAAMSFYRDLHQFYSSKDELFAERTSGLIFFENMMGIFFSGKDLTEEVLAQTLPDMRFVVAEQKYDDTTGTPAMQLPGFAAVIKLRDPEGFDLVMKEAWQKAIGLVNFTRGQKALPGLIIDSATHGGTTYTTAFFSVADEEDKSAVDIRFNFQPALAIAGDHLIMSSTDALARDLIDALHKEAAENDQALAGRHSLAMLQGAPLASILQANRSAMVRQNMVEKGHSQEDAEKEVDGILTALKYLDRLAIEAGDKAGLTQLKMTLGYKLP